MVSNRDVRLWYRGNWNWYLKHDFRFEDDVVSADFHEERPYSLVVALSNFLWRS